MLVINIESVNADQRDIDNRWQKFRSMSTAFLTINPISNLNETFNSLTGATGMTKCTPGVLFQHGGYLRSTIKHAINHFSFWPRTHESEDSHNFSQILTNLRFLRFSEISASVWRNSRSWRPRDSVCRGDMSQNKLI
jgi:hypothetical protein